MRQSSVPTWKERYRHFKEMAQHGEATYGGLDAQGYALYCLSMACSLHAYGPNLARMKPVYPGRAEVRKHRRGHLTTYTWRPSSDGNGTSEEVRHEYSHP